MTTHFVTLALTLFVSAAQAEAAAVSFDSNAERLGQPAQFTADVGAADRISAADRLRTLSQEIAAETCFLHNGILPEQNLSALAGSIAEFDDILNALLHHDPDRHIIGDEKDTGIIREIQSVMLQWEPLQAAAEQVLADPANQTATQLIYAQSEPFLETTSHLLSELEAQYSHPTQVLMSDVLLIEFAGRQAMLTQKIAYDTCLVWSGFGGQDQIEELEQICAEFDLIANALHDGMDAVGIQPAPTAEIRMALEEVVLDWDEVLVHIEHVADGGAAGRDNIRWIDEVMTKKMHRMEDIVQMYVNYSRRAII